MAGAAYFCKTLYTHGSAEFSGTLDVAGEVEIDNSVRIKKFAEIDGSLDVGGTLEVKDHAIFESPVAMKMMLNTHTFYNKEKATFNGEAVFNKNAEFKDIKAGIATFSQATIREGLMVGGDAMFVESAQIEVNLYVGNCTYLKKHLDVSGLTTLYGGLLVESDSGFADSLSVGKNLNVGGKFFCHADAAFKNGISVGGKLGVNGETKFEDTIEAEDIIARNLKLDGDLEASYIDAKKIKTERDIIAGNDLEVGNNLHVHGGAEVKELDVEKHVSCETFDAKEAEIKGDITIGGDAIVKKGLCVAGNTILKEVHCDDLFIGEHKVRSGIYHSDISSNKNVDYFVSYDCQYMQVGNIITVSGRADVEPLKEGSTHIQLSLPIQANFKDSHHLSGTGTSHDGLISAVCFGDQVTNRAQISYQATTTDRVALFFTFTYRV